MTGPLITSIPEFQMSLLLFVALAGYLIAYRINQLAVVGIILAGIAVGPSWLGLITYTDFVSSLANLGAVVLLFTIGLEFRIEEISKPWYFLIALLGILLPWGGGFLLAEAFHFDFNASIFIGTALTATSIAITANVLREMGRLQTRAAKAIIGAAVIDDILALLALSVSEGLVSGTLSLSSISIVLLKAVAFLVIGALTGRLAVVRLMERFSGIKLTEKYPESVFLFAMMIAFLYALVAEMVGLSAIVGAFLAGISLAGVNVKHGQIFKDGANHLQIIFASIFFVSLGVILDLHVISLNLAWFILALSILAILTKLIGCGLPAKLSGMSLKDSLVVGVGMAPRGEVAMIVALLGLNQKLIGQQTYVALILMSLLTTVFPPLLLKNWLFKGRDGIITGVPEQPTPPR
jgi:Kef-type K+ transport system membrane component KefB